MKSCFEIKVVKINHILAIMHSPVMRLFVVVAPDKHDIAIKQWLKHKYVALQLVSHIDKATEYQSEGYPAAQTISNLNSVIQVVSQ